MLPPRLFNKKLLFLTKKKLYCEKKLRKGQDSIYPKIEKTLIHTIFLNPDLISLPQP
jgi:hypothetical protein